MSALFCRLLSKICDDSPNHVSQKKQEAIYLALNFVTQTFHIYTYIANIISVTKEVISHVLSEHCFALNIQREKYFYLIVQLTF